MEKRYYAAYGSNLNILQMRYRCPSARVIGVAEISDYRLLFKGSKTGAYLTIEKQKGSVVPVGIWEVSESDERSLDRYEGFPNFYYKTEMSLDIKGISLQKSYRHQTVTEKYLSLQHTAVQAGLMRKNLFRKVMRYLVRPHFRHTSLVPSLRCRTNF